MPTIWAQAFVYVWMMAVWRLRMDSPSAAAATELIPRCPGRSRWPLDPGQTATNNMVATPSSWWLRPRTQLRLRVVIVTLLARPITSWLPLPVAPPPPSAPSGESHCGDDPIVVSTWEALKAATTDAASRPACIKLEPGTYSIDETLVVGNWSIALIAQGQDVTLDGDGMHQVVHVVDHSKVGLYGLTITNGSATFGGAVFNSETSR